MDCVVVKPQKVISILNNLRGYREKLGQLAAIPGTEFLRDFAKVESAKHLLQVSIEMSNRLGQQTRTPLLGVKRDSVLLPESCEALYYLCGGSHVTYHGPAMPGLGLSAVSASVTPIVSRFRMRGNGHVKFSNRMRRPSGDHCGGGPTGQLSEDLTSIPADNWTTDVSDGDHR